MSIQVNRHLNSSTVYRQPLQVGEMAKICQVSKKSIINWIRHGDIEAFRIRGGHYRVWPADLYKFITKIGMKVGFQFVDDHQSCFLILDDNLDKMETLTGLINTLFKNAKVIITQNAFTAAAVVGERKLEAIFFNLEVVGKKDQFHLLQMLGEKKRERSMKVISLVDIESIKSIPPVVDGILTSDHSIKVIKNSLEDLLLNKQST